MFITLFISTLQNHGTKVTEGVITASYGSEFRKVYRLTDYPIPTSDCQCVFPVVWLFGNCFSIAVVVTVECIASHGDCLECWQICVQT